MYNDLMTELFAPYVYALNNYDYCCDNYIAAERAANDILHEVEKRQKDTRSQIAAKLAELESEEKRLKASIRQRVLRGDASPSADMETGAKLAVIAEQKAALQILSEKRKMTDEEKAQWETAVSVLDDAATDINKAILQRTQETEKLKVYVRSLEFWGAQVPNRNRDALLSKAYSLNADGGIDDEE